MSSDLGQFLEACGANGPLRLEWDDWETGRINLEMKATGAGLARPDPGTSTKAATVGDAAANGDPEPGPGAPHPRLVDPEAVHSLVGERLVAWERARRSRRQRVTTIRVVEGDMDGLAAGVGLVASLLFAAAQVQMGGLFAPAVLLVLAGSLGGFLVYNRYPARVFLGDSGGGFIGFLLGAMTVAGTYFRYGRDDSPSGVLSPLLVMAVPLYESVWVFLFWLRERNNSFLRNRRHFSYRLLESGLTPPQAVRVVVLVSRAPASGAVAPPARRAGDAPGRGAVGLSDRRAGHPRERFHQAGAGTMTMGTMGCSGAAVGARAERRGPSDLRPPAPSVRIGGVGRRGPTRGRGGGR